MLPVVLGFCLLLPIFSLPTAQKVDLSPILALLPLSDIKAIAHNHMEHDLNFQAAMKYFKSAEWVDMVQKLRENKQWQEYKDYLNKLGIDINNAVGSIEHCLNMTDTSKLDVDVGSANLTNFMTEVRSKVGLSVMKAMGEASKKMELPEMKKLFDNVSSKESQQEFEKVAALLEFRKIIAKLTSFGIRFEVAFDMMYAIFGWKIPANLLG